MNIFQLIITVLIVLALLGAGVWLFFDHINTAGIPPTAHVLLTGTVECLQHNAPAGTPTTMECMYGLYDPITNNHYRLQNGTATGTAVTQFPVGTSVIVDGMFSPKTDTEYKTTGTITVQKITKVANTTTTNTGSTTEQTTSDGTITFAVPKDFGLAVTKEQILKTAVVPPCVEGFNYCLYYTGTAYENTNLISAGVSITDLSSSSTSKDCLNTPPSGYTTMKPSATSTTQDYQMSVFAPLSEGAAGSSSIGEEYRLFTSNVCYALTARIGLTNVQSSTTVQILTKDQEETLLSKLRDIIAGIMITKTRATLMLPQR